ncbi:hypothetical protein GCM10020000_12170 [Streptomyces olivoverticillatus]
MQLNKELAAVFGDVSPTLFYEFPTLRAVAGHLATDHAPKARVWTGTTGITDEPSRPAAAVTASRAPAPAPPRPRAASPSRSSA